jgi:hypothetical protein
MYSIHSKCITSSLFHHNLNWEPKNGGNEKYGLSVLISNVFSEKEQIVIPDELQRFDDITGSVLDFNYKNRSLTFISYEDFKRMFDESYTIPKTISNYYINPEWIIPFGRRIPELFINCLVKGGLKFILYLKNQWGEFPLINIGSHKKNILSLFIQYTSKLYSQKFQIQNLPHIEDLYQNFEMLVGYMKQTFGHLDFIDEDGDYGGNTPIFWAVASREYFYIKCLIKNGANLFIRDKAKQSNSLLWWVCGNSQHSDNPKKEFSRIIRLLLKYGGEELWNSFDPDTWIRIPKDMAEELKKRANRYLLRKRLQREQEEQEEIENTETKDEENDVDTTQVSERETQTESIIIGNTEKELDDIENCILSFNSKDVIKVWEENSQILIEMTAKKFEKAFGFLLQKK